MIYKFKSKASGDVIMLGPVGDKVLALIGKEPAAQGIITPEAMPAAIAALQEAARQDEALRASLGQAPEAAADADAPKLRPGEVSLRQRVWPMVDMLQRCQAQAQPIVWGV
jgi:hypothetical protein